MDHEAQSVVIEATNMLLLSKYIEPQAEALHTLSRLSRFGTRHPLPLVYRAGECAGCTLMGLDCQKL
jgi:hypothetical protein